MALLEVEQKFVLYLSRIGKFKANQGAPPFRHLKFLGVNSFRDTYYDWSGQLCAKGLYIRKRDHEWEAKQSVQGNFTRSTFAETTDTTKIREMIQNYLPTCAEAKDNFGLDIFAEFKTSRENYLVDGKFNVALDQTDFGHAVGEVELMAENATRAHREIDDFMKEYSWFFSTEPPKGKLTAYFERYGLPNDCYPPSFPLVVWG